jgi:cephalosporin-C deacetylase
MGSPSLPHGYAFDPGYNMDLAQLLAIDAPQPPADFVDFWQQRHAAALALSPRPRIQLASSPYPHHAVYELRYTSTDAIEIGGWVLLPNHGRVRRGVVFGHGYGGCELPQDLLPVDDAVMLFPCFRGIGCSPVAGVSSDPNLHVLHHIEDRQRYIIGGCVDDLWLAVSALLALFPEVAGQVAYSGVSFGGGIGALAAPWDARMGRLHLQVPTFGHQALRLTLPSVGSGESVRSFQRQHDFQVMDTLAYFDAASAARYLRIPVLVAAALFDPVVPPPGQFAVFNAIAEPLKRLFVLQSGHFDDAAQAQQLREMHQQVAKFFMLDSTSMRLPSIQPPHHFSTCVCYSD